MLSFKEYLLESATNGNYVCAYSNPPPIPNEFLPKSGKIVPVGKHHITLVYSQFSEVDSRILSNLISMLPPELELVVTGADCFDSKDAEGNTTDKSTLVVKVKNKFVDNLHASLISLGMQHSYDQFEQHVTIAYDVDMDECHKLAADINMWLQEWAEPLKIYTTSYHSEGIEKNWAETLKK